jgi:3-oxoadipate enol-lactonase/4-carboxymuconolactone decarboxylase
MPVALLDDLACHYRTSGPDAAPALMLAHSLGQDHGMWDPQAPDLSEHFLLVRYDVRGHGASTAAPGHYTIEQLGRDALRLADALGLARFAFCGLSLGGMIAQWLAANAPDRVTAAVLANTSSRADADRMETRRRAVLSGGMGAVADTVMSRFFSAEALEKNPPLVAAARRTLLATNPVGYAGCCAAIRDMNLTSSLRAIRVPTLVIDGELDTSLPWAGHGDLLAQELPHARIVHLRAGHLSNLETPRAFTSAVLDFLLPSESSALDAGLRVRRAVLGDAHVERALATAGETSAAFQDLITRYAWGGVWSRPGLDIRTRRLLALALAASLGRWDEFRLHVRAGLAHGLEWCDLEEALLHTAVYGGVPAANTGFRVAAEEREALKTSG